MTATTNTLSHRDLQDLALGQWASRRPLAENLWRYLAREGLYPWAVEQQARVFTGAAAPVIPSLDALLAPEAPAQLQLTPPPSPAPQTDAKPPSQRRLNRGRRAAEAVLARRNQEQALAYAPRDFVQFSIPHKRIDSNVFERANGKYRFRIETGGGHCIPFGADRLFPLWLATAFKASGQPADGRIRCRSASDILAAFRVPVEGGATRTLSERIERWFHTTLYVYDESIPERRRFKSYRLLNGGQLWYQREKTSVNQYTLWQNVLELAPEFAEDLRLTSIPVDFETVVTLRDMPGALDLYIWQAHRSWELLTQGANRPMAVPLRLLLDQLGSRSPPRKAKQLFRRWQGVIKEIWPQCPNFFDGTKDLFFINPGRAVFDRSTTKLPGVLPSPPVPLRVSEGPQSPQEGIFLRLQTPT